MATEGHDREGEKERAVRKCVVVGMVLALAWATTVLGGERPKFATGTFVSAELADAVVKWTIDLGGDAGKKVYEMTADVKTQYVEKEGVKEAQAIRAAAGRDFKEKEGAVVAKGKFKSATLKDENVVVTITPAEGEKALEVTLPKKVAVMYREGDEGKLIAISVGVPRPPKAEGK
jgi:hypothetical protein